MEKLRDIILLNGVYYLVSLEKNKLKVFKGGESLPKQSNKIRDLTTVGDVIWEIDNTLQGDPNE